MQKPSHFICICNLMNYICWTHLRGQRSMLLKFYKNRKCLLLLLLVTVLKMMSYLCWVLIFSFFSCIKQKCHRLFIDASINSERQMLKNVYQMFVLAVFKLHTHVRYLSFYRKELSHSNFLMGKSILFQDMLL